MQTNDRGPAAPLSGTVREGRDVDDRAGGNASGAVVDLSDRLETQPKAVKAGAVGRVVVDPEPDQVAVVRPVDGVPVLFVDADEVTLDDIVEHQVDATSSPSPSGYPAQSETTLGRSLSTSACCAAVRPPTWVGSAAASALPDGCSSLSPDESDDKTAPALWQRVPRPR